MFRACLIASESWRWCVVQTPVRRRERSCRALQRKPVEDEHRMEMLRSSICHTELADLLARKKLTSACATGAACGAGEAWVRRMPEPRMLLRCWFRQPFADLFLAMAVARSGTAWIPWSIWSALLGSGAIGESCPLAELIGWRGVCLWPTGCLCRLQQSLQPAQVGSSLFGLHCCDLRSALGYGAAATGAAGRARQIPSSASRGVPDLGEAVVLLVGADGDELDHSAPLHGGGRSNSATSLPSLRW